MNLFILNRTNKARVLVLGGSVGVLSLAPYEAKALEANLITAKMQQVIRNTLNSVIICEEVPAKYQKLHELFLNKSLEKPSLSVDLTDSEENTPSDETITPDENKSSDEDTAPDENKSADENTTPDEDKPSEEDAISDEDKPSEEDITSEENTNPNEDKPSEEDITPDKDTKPISKESKNTKNIFRNKKGSSGKRNR